MNHCPRFRARVRVALACSLLWAAGANAKPPEWLQQQAAVAVLPQSDETTAVRLLSETELVVAANGKVRRRVRGAVRILRRGGEQYSVVRATQDSWSKVQHMRVWVIPASGKSTEAGTKDAIETSMVDVAGGELITDARMKVLGVAGAAVGATVGFEIQTEGSALELADYFRFQDAIPVIEARYLLRLPRGWQVTPSWINHTPQEAQRPAANEWHWTLRDIPAVAIESRMPSWDGVTGQLFLAFSPPDSVPRLSSWRGIGTWMLELSRDRAVATPEIRARAAELLAGHSQPLARIRALATFVQQEVRYVGIQLGIGGFQPHYAADVLRNRYGDCKDKALLLGVLLAEAGIQSLPVLVNTDRTQVGPHTPPSLRFDHVILAIRLPGDADAGALQAIGAAPDGGTLLYFDPTDEFTSLGRLPGLLQGGHGLLVLPEESQLVQLPVVEPGQNGVRRSGQLKLSAEGVLTGDLVEQFIGEQGDVQRRYLRGVAREADLFKPLEARLADSMAAFRITAATIGNQTLTNLPLEWRFSLTASAYARRSGDLVMLRPRLLGTKAEQLPDEKTARVHDFLLGEVRTDHDEFVIELPAGYMPDSVPDPVEVDLGFAAYRSRTEINGTTLRYSRTYEVREPLLPAARLEEYRRLHREIARDERAVVLLKAGG